MYFLKLPLNYLSSKNIKIFPAKTLYEEVKNNIFHRSFFVITKKIIIRNPSAFGLRQKVELYPYEKIVDVKLEKGMLSSAININVPGSIYNGYIDAIPKDDAEALLKIIYERMKEKKTLSSDDDPLIILKKRFAKGEITKEEYEDMKSVLE